MNFEEAKAFQKQLNEILDNATKIMKEKFDQYRNGMGLVPDNIRESPEYQEVKKELDRAFQAYRNFNGWMNKQFKKEIKKEVAENRKNRFKKAQ